MVDSKQPQKRVGVDDKMPFAERFEGAFCASGGGDVEFVFAERLGGDVFEGVVAMDLRLFKVAFFRILWFGVGTATNSSARVRAGG